MYQEYWELARLPFENVPDPSFFFEAEQFKESLTRLKYVAESRKGAAVLIGEVGCGKTTLSRKLIQELSPDQYDIAMVVSPNLSSLEFLQEILYQFNPSPSSSSSSKSQLKQVLNQHLFKNFELGRDTLIIVDEAQLLSEEVMEEIRLLLNFQLNDRFLLTLLMLGQPDLQDAVDRLPQLEQRIAIRAYLQSLTLTETASYVRFRLGKAGGRTDIFSENAFREIFVASGGIPRRINTLCDFCFMVGAAQRKGIMDGAFVRCMALDLRGNVRSADRTQKRLYTAGASF